MMYVLLEFRPSDSDYECVAVADSVEKLVKRAERGVGEKLEWERVGNSSAYTVGRVYESAFHIGPVELVK